MKCPFKKITIVYGESYDYDKKIVTEFDDCYGSDCAACRSYTRFDGTTRFNCKLMEVEKKK